eukprot:GILI01021282.1.p1 GENE.GILI01021282.1~~GILI01021282.1.p1  ORF type:complete len:174 (+),score=21.19 GILI01021282.1:328-849(+)
MSCPLTSLLDISGGPGEDAGMCYFLNAQRFWRHVYVKGQGATAVTLLRPPSAAAPPPSVYIGRPTKRRRTESGTVVSVEIPSEEDSDDGGDGIAAIQRVARECDRQTQLMLAEAAELLAKADNNFSQLSAPIGTALEANPEKKGTRITFAADDEIEIIVKTKPYIPIYDWCTF